MGIEAAERLGPLVPAAGHLVHMPGHIWIRVGRYHDAVVANEQAVLADDDYLAQCHAQGLYPIGYVPHNHHFLWVAAALGGEKATALASAGHMGHHAGMMGEPGMEFLQHFSMSLLYAQALFGEWDAILATPAPPDSLVYPTGVWRFARGLAFVGTGQRGRGAARARRAPAARRRHGARRAVRRAQHARPPFCRSPSRTSQAKSPPRAASTTRRSPRSKRRSGSKTR